MTFLLCARGPNLADTLSAFNKHTQAEAIQREVIGALKRVLGAHGRLRTPLSEQLVSQSPGLRPNLSGNHLALCTHWHTPSVPLSRRPARLELRPASAVVRCALRNSRASKAMRAPVARYRRSRGPSPPVSTGAGISWMRLTLGECGICQRTHPDDAWARGRLGRRGRVRCTWRWMGENLTLDGAIVSQNLAQKGRGLASGQTTQMTLAC